MSLTLENLGHERQGRTVFSDVNQTLEPGGLHVLLGRMSAGKTTLMRVIAGLERASAGRISLNSHDITRLPVQKRGIAMVYQQFVNYPAMTVAENIASPLKLAKVPTPERKRRVQEVAELLQLENYLDQYPSNLSGGQQQRCALARALVKDAAIILLDEPLGNLDVKLRESLLSELKRLFAARDSIGLYATSEASEALALGGDTLLMDKGRIVQRGSALQLHQHPVDLNAARLVHEPIINVFTAVKKDQQLSLYGHPLIGLNGKSGAEPNADYSVGIRAHDIQLSRRSEDDIRVLVTVSLAEIAASQTYLHVHCDGFEGIVLLSGIHPMATDSGLEIFLPQRKLYVFDPSGKTLISPFSPNSDISRGQDG